MDVAGYCTESEGRLAAAGLVMRNVVITYKGKYCGKAGGGFADAERRQLKAFFDQFPTQTNVPIDIIGHMNHNFMYIPNTGLKLEIAYQEVLPSNILYCLRCIRIIYPQKVSIVADKPNPNQISSFFLGEYVFYIKISNASSQVIFEVEGTRTLPKTWSLACEHS